MALQLRPLIESGPNEFTQFGIDHMNDLDGKYKILIADDDPTSLAILAAMLEKAGYDILIAVDGGQAF